jgi:hypothetical protein
MDTLLDFFKGFVSEPETLYLNYNYMFIMCWWVIGIFYAKRNVEYEEKLNLMIEQKEIKINKTFFEHFKSLIIPVSILGVWTFIVYNIPLFINVLISWTPLWFFYINQLKKDYYDSKHRLLDYRMNLTLAMVSSGIKKDELDSTIRLDKESSKLLINDNIAA